MSDVRTQKGIALKVSGGVGAVSVERARFLIGPAVGIKAHLDFSAIQRPTVEVRSLGSLER